MTLTTNRVTIREATPQDVEAVRELMDQLGYPSTIEQMMKRLTSTYHHPDYRMLLAENDMGALGLINLMRALSMEHDGAYVRVLALVVHGRAREEGIGRQLIAAAERWATEHGAARLVLTCGHIPERAAAHRFYPSVGFEAVGTSYRKKL